MKKRRLVSMCLCAALLFSTNVHASVPDYEDTVNALKQDDQKIEPEQVTQKGSKTVKMLARQDDLYVKDKTAILRENPDEKAAEVRKAAYGTALERTHVCDNGWSKVTLTLNEDTYTGFVETAALTQQKQVEPVEETVSVLSDSDVVDYPARKDGKVVGEVLEDDQVIRTGVINDVWSRIIYQDGEGKNHLGYVPTDVLDVEQNVQEVEVALAGEEAGTLHKGSGTGIFAEAVDGVTQVKDGDATAVTGVQVGEPIAVSSSATLKSLGKFRITHYCACSICCGAFSNGYTATGTRATTNRTIAVNPKQIPYGSKVVINGQVYVAEDCGGAIVDNCIDVYVATHEEGLSKGTYYTDVYLLQE